MVEGTAARADTVLYGAAWPCNDSPCLPAAPSAQQPAPRVHACPGLTGLWHGGVWGGLQDFHCLLGFPGHPLPKAC